MAKKRPKDGDDAPEPEPAEAPSCLLKSLPDDLLVAAADNAVEVNPVNAPMIPQQMLASVAMPEGIQFLALLTTKYWGAQPRTLSVQFLDTPAGALRTKLLKYMNVWSKSGCIKFAVTNGRGEVRVSRAGSGYWSYLGTDVLMVSSGPTMNLQGFTTRTPQSEWDRVVPHETGHTLGYPHEHMRSEFVRNIDPAKAVAYFQRNYGWPPQMTEQNVLTPLDDRTIMGTPADEDSIMAYQLPAAIMRDGDPVRGGAKVIASDHAFNARVYPKAKSSPFLVPEPHLRPPMSLNEELARDRRRALDQINRLKAAKDELKSALSLAVTDLHQWTQLARYQREMMDQNLGWCPTQAGLDASENTLDRIAKALRTVEAEGVSRGENLPTEHHLISRGPRASLP